PPAAVGAWRRPPSWAGGLCASLAFYFFLSLASASRNMRKPTRLGGRSSLLTDCQPAFSFSTSSPWDLTVSYIFLFAFGASCRRVSTRSLTTDLASGRVRSTLL